MRANIANVVGIATIVGLAVAIFFEHQWKRALGREHQTLEQRLEEMSRLAGSNEQLSDLVAEANFRRAMDDDQSHELLRLRGQVSVLRQQTKELETLRAENRQAHATL